MASLITAIIGPFSTYDAFSFVERLLYWGGLIIALVFPAILIRAVTFRTFKAPPLALDFISAALVAVAIGPLVWLFNHFVMGFHVSTFRIVAEHIGIAGLVCLVPVGVRAYLRMRLGELQVQAEAPPVVIATEGQEAFLHRLDPDVRGNVMRVSADDHQVDVWTDLGVSKLRLRFGDALKELMEFHGTRVHRSHWVAFETIEAIVPNGRRHEVRLACGMRLPVSQRGLEALQDAGFSVQIRKQA